MPKFIDLHGMRFGRLSVIKRVENQGVQTVWLCSCVCGKEARVISQNLTSGRQVSCGCHDYERKTKHGGTAGKRSPEWYAWQNMKKRCYYADDKAYPDYGGRGIKVCDRWLHSFENFLEDMGTRPSKNHTIERIDVNKDYHLDNCMWASRSRQIINQRLRHDNTSGHKGVSWDKTKSKWNAYIKPGNNQKRINLGYFSELEDAIQARKAAELKYHALAE